MRAGAIRVGATSDKGTLDPLAVINTDGRHTVVVKATAATCFTVACAKN